MKYIFLISCFVCIALQPTFAAFPIHHPVAETQVIKKTTFFHVAHNTPKPSDDNGIYGVLSFVMAMLSYISIGAASLVLISSGSIAILFVPFALSVAAVVLGIIGMDRDKRLRGLAITGFVMGIMVAAPLALVLIIAAAVSAGG